MAKGSNTTRTRGSLSIRVSIVNGGGKFSDEVASTISAALRYENGGVDSRAYQAMRDVVNDVIPQNSRTLFYNAIQQQNPTSPIEISKSNVRKALIERMSGEAEINGTETEYYRGAQTMANSLFSGKERDNFYKELGKNVDSSRVDRATLRNREAERSARERRQSGVRFRTSRLTSRGEG